MVNTNTSPSRGLQDIEQSQLYTEAIDTLCRAFIQAAKAKCESIGYDQTFRSTVVAVNGSREYTILDNGTEVKNVPACVNGASIVVGTPVWVKIPCGQRSKMYICNVID